MAYGHAMPIGGGMPCYAMQGGVCRGGYAGMAGGCRQVIPTIPIGIEGEGRADGASLLMRSPHKQNFIF